MYKQHSIVPTHMKDSTTITQVFCETTGTIYYTNGTQKSWSREALLKSAEQNKKDVFQFRSNK